MKKILLVRWGGLGDLLVVLPAIRLIRSGLPSATLTLLGRREYGSLLLQAKVVDEVVGQDDPRVLTLFSGAASAGDERSDWLDGFDLVVSWLNQARSGVPEAARGRTGGHGMRQTICFDAQRREAMSAFFYRKTLEAVSGDLFKRTDFRECAKLPLDLIPDDRSFPFPRPPAPSRRLAVIHPGSGGEKKRWPLENFLEIAGRLHKQNVDGVFVTGEAEADLDRSVEAAARSLGWMWLESPSLASLARLFGDADLYLGNDSGVTHLAAACGARVLALFRNDLVDIWRPFGDSHLLSADSVDGISLESVWRAAAELLCN
jgi:heptosyltransferase III